MPRYSRRNLIDIRRITEDNMNIKELREIYGMNLTQFSSYFKIPYRILQHWEYGTRKCPEYLIELMEYKLKNEKGI